MSDIIYREFTAGTNSRLLGSSARRALVNIQRNSLVRSDLFRSEVIAQSEKLDAIDGLAQKAMTGQRLLQQCSEMLSAGNPFVADDLKCFVDIAKAGKVQIIADTIRDFSQEGHR